MELFRIRASAAGLIMTDPKTKADKDAGRLGETAKTYMKDWEWAKEIGREKDLDTNAIEKGNLCEEDGFDLISIQKGIMIYKNPFHLENEWATGTPDPYDRATGKLLPFDNKCSYTWETFPHKADKLPKVYEWQDIVYGWLGGFDEYSTIYTLVNAPAAMVRKEKDSRWWKMGCPDRQSAEFIAACQKIERKFIYDMELFLKTCSDGGEPFELHSTDWIYDIPASKRIREFKVAVTQPDIDALIERVKQCREYIKNPY